MNTQPPTDINAYIAVYPPEVRARLADVRATILAAVPDALETISYGMPTFTHRGRAFVHFAAFKAHIGLYPCPAADGAWAQYKAAKSALRFAFAQPLPLEVIAAVARQRVRDCVPPTATQRGS